MPRKKLYRHTELPYHITARCSNKDWFAIPISEVWEIFSIYLHFISHAYDVRIHSFVLMNNHFHMLISTPQANIDESMNYLLREVSRSIGKASDRINQIFGGPYHWSLISNSIYYQHAYKYIYRNPIRAGLSRSVEEYKYSTLRGLLGFERLLIPAIDNLDLIQNPTSQLQWLNSTYDEEIQEAIRLALKKKEFAFPRDPATQKRSFLEDHVV